MSSTRLPGKVLLPLAGEPALARILERLARCTSIDQRVVGTSVDPSDDPIVSLCRVHGVACVRGSLEDVLARYHLAARETAADVVVRITADCPLVDPELVDQCVEAFLADRHRIDYLSNTAGRTFPVGLDVEVFSMAALGEGFRLAMEPADREHVTPYLIRTCRTGAITQPVPLGRLRWTVDYPDDYVAVARLYDRLYPANPGFGRADVYRLLEADPSLLHTSSRGADPGEGEEVYELLVSHLGKGSVRAPARTPSAESES